MKPVRQTAVQQPSLLLLAIRRRWSRTPPLVRRSTGILLGICIVLIFVALVSPEDARRDAPGGTHHSGGTRHPPGLASSLPSTSEPLPGAAHPSDGTDEGRRGDEADADAVRPHHSLRVAKPPKDYRDGVTKFFADAGSFRCPQSATFTKEEVAAHASEDDLWVVIDGNVLDVTSFVRQHPGGKIILDGAGGSDMASLFTQFHHPSTVLLFNNFCIGRLRE